MRGMPATFPAHPAAVLPLKLWRPAWFDGVALAVGSMAPDLTYALDGSRLEKPLPGLPPLFELAHSLPWFVAWAVPVTFVLCPLIRLSAPAFARHVPFALPGLASLGRGPRWHVTLWSAAVGALSHVLWDRIAVGPLDLASSLLGGVFGLWLLLHLARRRPPNPPTATPSTAAPSTTAASAATAPRAAAPAATPSTAAPSTTTAPAATASAATAPRAAAPAATPSTAAPSTTTASAATAPAACPPPPSADGLIPSRGRRRAALYWGTVAVVLGTGVAFLPFLPGYFLPHTTSARVILVVIAAFIAAAAATARSRLFGREPVQQ